MVGQVRGPGMAAEVEQHGAVLIPVAVLQVEEAAGGRHHHPAEGRRDRHGRGRGGPGRPGARPGVPWSRPGRGRARLRVAGRLASGQPPFAKAAPERMPEAAAQQRDGRDAEPPLEPAHQPDPHGQQQVGDGQAMRQRQPRRRRRCRRRWFAPPMPKGRRRVPAPGRRASLRRHGRGPGAAERAVHAMPPRWRGSAVLEVFLACHIISTPREPSRPPVPMLRRPGRLPRGHVARRFEPGAGSPGGAPGGRRCV